MFEHLDQYTIIFALCMLFLPELQLPALLILMLVIPRLFKNTYLITSTILYFLFLPALLFLTLDIPEFVFCLFGVEIFVIVSLIIGVLHNVKGKHVTLEVQPYARRKILFLKQYIFIIPIEDEVFVAVRISLFGCKKNIFIINKETSDIINFDWIRSKLIMAVGAITVLLMTMFSLGRI